MGRLRYHCLSGLLLLLALAARAEEATAVPPCDKNDDEHGEDKFEHFTEIFYTVLFIVLVWISGKIAAAAGALAFFILLGMASKAPSQPALVGSRMSVSFSPLDQVNPSLCDQYDVR